MNWPKTADGATICYGDVVYYLDYSHEGRLPEPFIRTLTICEANLSLHNGTWLIKRPENAQGLLTKFVYRDRRRVVTMCRNYWKERIKEFRAKLQRWNDDVKIRKLCHVIQANQT